MHPMVMTVICGLRRESQVWRIGTGRHFSLADAIHLHVQRGPSRLIVAIDGNAASD